jgi:predicted Zn-dependent peptidase
LERGYTAENIVVGVAGNVDVKVVKKAVTALFEKVKKGKKVKARKAVEKQSAPQMFVKKKKIDQTQFVVGCRAYHATHKDRAALGVLAAILGGGMSSRMFIEVRERRGLAYRVGTGVDTFVDAGYLETHCGVEHENLEKALEVVIDEYRKICQEPVSKAELTKAKEGIKGRMAMGLEGSDEVVEFLVGQEVLHGEIKMIKDKVKEIERVTATDVQRVAQDIFRNKKLNLAVIAPKVNKKKLEQLLTF